MNKKIPIKIFSLLMSFVLIFVAIPTSRNVVAATLSEEKNKLSAMQNKKKNLANELKTIEKELASIKNKEKKAIADIGLLDREIALVEEDITLTESIIVELGLNIEAEDAKILEKEKQLDENQEKLNDMIRTQYEAGDSSYWGYILGSEDIWELLSAFDLLSDIFDYQQAILDDIENNKLEIIEFKKSLQANKDENEVLKKGLDVDKKKLDSKLAEARQQVENLQKSQEDQERLYEEIEKDNERIMAEIQKQILAIQAKEESEKKYNGGTFMYPLNKQYARVTSRFGYRVHPITGKKNNHSGMDIPAPSGTAIYAAADGKVIIAKVQGTYGNCVVIHHGGGVTTLYAHIKANGILVKEGDTVKKGQTIALVGSTGMSTGNHLHFEVSVNGKREDPEKYFKGMKFRFS